jgi:hypothetical protein
VRYFAAFLAVSAFVLSVAAVASNDWANSFDVTTDSRVTKFGLFNYCKTSVNDADGMRFEFCCQSTCHPGGCRALPLYLLFDATRQER